MPKTTLQGKAEKAAYDRKRKANDRKAKRFSNPFKIFVERKYPDVYNDFVKFFNYLECVNPRKKDLTKSEAFKKWLTDYPVSKKDISSTTTSPVTLNLTSPDEVSTSSSFPILSSILQSETETVSSNINTPTLSLGEVPVTLNLTSPDEVHHRSFKAKRKRCYHQT